MTTNTAQVNNIKKYWDNVAPYEYRTTQVPSSTEPNVWHTVTTPLSDPTDKSCSCKGWKFTRRCKHARDLSTGSDTRRPGGKKHYVWRNHTFPEDQWKEFTEFGWNDAWGAFPGNPDTVKVDRTDIEAPPPNAEISGDDHDDRDDWIGQKCWLSQTIPGLDDDIEGSEDGWVPGTITKRFPRTKDMYTVTFENGSTIACHINSLIRLHAFEWDTDWVWESVEDDDYDDEEDCDDDDYDDEEDCDDDDYDDEEDDEDGDGDGDGDDEYGWASTFFDKDFCCATGTKQCESEWFDRTPQTFTKYDLIRLITCKNKDGRSLLEKAIETPTCSIAQNNAKEMLAFLQKSIDA